MVNDSITITPDWDTQGQEELVFTDALLTHIQATIDVPLGSFEHRLIFLVYNGLLYRAIEVHDVESYNNDGSIKDGRAYYFLFNGNYLDGYVVENSHLTKRLVLQEYSAKGANSSMMKTGEGTDQCEGSMTCGIELDEVVIDSGSDTDASTRIVYWLIFNNEDEPQFSNGQDEGPGGHNSGGGGGGTNGNQNNSDDDNQDDTECDPGHEQNEQGDCIPVWSENQQNNLLCGDYNFQTVGNASIANIANLGFRAVHPTEGQLNASFSSPLCITIPNYNLPLGQTSKKFNAAWALTMNEIMVFLNNTDGIFNPTPTQLRLLMVEYLIDNLNDVAGIPNGVTILTSACPGITISIANYCN